MKFKAAKSAVKWAENRLNRSFIKSQMSSLQKSSAMGYGDLSADELDDIAQTITHITQNIKKPKGPALLAVYGLDTPSRDWVLADYIALHAVQNRFPAVKELSHSQLKTFLLCVIKDVRAIESGSRELPKRQYYALCNLNEYRWKKMELAVLRSMAQSMLNGWIDDAARTLEEELDAIDMFAE